MSKIAQLAKLVLDYRKAEKILTTYIVGVYQYIQNDGKVHSDFYLNPDDFDKGGTKTGRLSSANPNLQNQVKKPIVLDMEEDEDGI